MHLISLALIVLGAATQAPIDGRTLRLENVDSSAAFIPLRVPIDIDAYEGRVVAIADGGTREYPVTVRNGELVCLIDKLPDDTTTELTLESRKPKKKPSVTVRKNKGADRIEVRINGDLFTAYHYSDDYKKPFLWPINSEGGATVTRDWPMGKRDRSRDHPHHKSFWTAYGDINGTNCWEEHEGTGIQRTGDVQFGSGDAYGWITSDNTWLDAAGRAVIREKREYRFYATPAATRIFDVYVTFTAAFGDAKFVDTKEGGLVGLRVTDALRERGGSGTITNAVGGVGAQACWGKPAAWCDYSGVIDGVGARGISVFDHPTNLRHPTSWHVRDYGLMGANCFGYSDFTDGAENGDYLLKGGESLTFKYRIYVHSGDVKKAKVAERYNEFASKAALRWTE